MNHTKTITFTTTQKLRLDEFLRENLSGEIVKLVSEEKLHASKLEVSNSKLRRLILSGNVFVNGKECRRPAFELRGRSTVCVEFDIDKFFFEKQPDDIKFTVTDNAVLFEDENLIFINKPAFFPVEQTITGNRDNLHDAVVDYLWKRNEGLRNPPYVGIMHRLDKNTSGVILFTKARGINKAVSDMFQGHNFTKTYEAVVCPKQNNTKIKLEPGKKFTVEKYMGRITGKSQEGKWGTVSEKNGGQYSKTDFEVLKKVNIDGKTCFVIKCDLYTGRTHQIRVHLSEEGFPIFGDELYGGVKADRLYLHAKTLECHNDELDFAVTAPVPWNL